MITAGYIHASLNASPLDVLPGQLVTASIGVHAIDTGIDDAAASEQALQVVDDALYAAKSAGRDQVRVAGTGAAPG